MRLAISVVKWLVTFVGAVIMLVYAILWAAFFFQQYVALSDDCIQESIQAIHPESYVDYFQWGEYRMRYVSVGPLTGQVLMLVHGSPGSIGNRTRFWSHDELYSRFRIIAADRIGHGQSHPGKPLVDIGKQSASQLALLDAIQGSGIASTGYAKPVVLGHSYGAPIVARMAMDQSEKMEAVILASAAIDPDHEIFWTIAKVMYMPGMRYTLPFWARVAHQEKETHIEQLQQHMTDRSKIDIPVYAIHGTEDILAPYENVFFIQKNLPPSLFSLITIEGGNHFQPFSATQEWVELVMGS